MDLSRRELLQVGALGAAALAVGARGAAAQPAPIEAEDRVFIANEDSNTISVIDPRSNTVDTTINLTSFDEDPRPPFRFVTGGATPTHAAMIHKPLYHGAIDVHGVVPSPDNRLLATAGRGSSNVYLIDTRARKVIGNTPNPQAGPGTNPERLSSGILVGREPHEPTFTRNGRELWIAVRGEDRLAILDVEEALRLVGTFFSHGREAHGLWTNPAHTLLYVAHEQDELPGTPNAGQTVATAFDVTDPFRPRFIAQIPLGALALPSGPLRNKKSINLVYVRPGARSQTA
ncbi:MAG: hypothetical protein K6T92_03870 [Candidatus Rokubacteria bacterium]|nr:hypothetical protein [Candidatus Rokubacteria bacterium]